MKKLFISFCLFSLTACHSYADGDTLTFTTTPSDNSIINEGFEQHGNLNKGLRPSIDGNGSIHIVNQPVFKGKSAVQFSVPNDGQSYRSELAGYPLAWGTYHYQFAIFIPKDWQPTHLETILAQWHGAKLSNGQDTNPPILLSIQNNHWRLAIHQLTSDTTVVEKGFVLPAMQSGVWNQFDVTIRWSTPTSPGVLTLYRNNELWFNYTGINNYHQKNVPYFKMGIYRPLWNPEKQIPYAVGNPPIVVYGDEIKITKD